eukprot:UN2431
MVLQCRVRPGSFVECALTLSGNHWPRHLQMDANFPDTNRLEWLLENPEDVIVYGLLVREFGPKADPRTFGRLACRVSDRNGGPEYEWTRLRAAQRLEEQMGHGGRNSP